MEDFLLSASDTFVVIAAVFILVQIFYLAQKLFIAKQLTGRFTWKRLRAAFRPKGWGQRIFQWFVAAIVVRDTLHFFFSPRGLPLSSLLFAIVLVLFVVTAAMDRYQDFGRIRPAAPVSPVEPPDGALTA
jgi:hypothetical protein